MPKFASVWPSTVLILSMLGVSCATTADKDAPRGGRGDEVVTQIYAVKDLVFQRASGEAAFIALNDLVANLCEATGSDYWHQSGHSIKAEDSGLVAVAASADVHCRVQTVIDDMRRFAQAR
jgi:hypothetical protein